MKKLVTLLVLTIVLSARIAFADRPNIVVIMVDDLGFSDLGCYGSEIETPCLDALAEDGIRFSQFYNTAKCHSSRVSLLTGQYCLAAGNTALSHAVTSAEILKRGGYFTAMTGKWHLKRQPTDFGFDRYFGHLSGACNFFKGDKTFRLNGQPWQVPDSDFYTTVADVDFALRFLTEARQTNNPWYLYIAFNAPHAPLHALPQDYAKYKGRYDQGWDVIRDARMARQMTSGLLPGDLQPSPRPEHIPAWDSMSEWRRKYESNRMTTLAAMIDRVDQEVARLVEDLRTNDELENTMILFVSDNGACPYDRRPPLLDVEPTNGDVSLGDSTGWAWARNSPFRYYKQNQFEGGISTPAIVHWPAGLKRQKGSIVHEPAHLIDVVPTLADITQCEIPETWPQRMLRPISGVSLRPIFDGQSIGSRPPIHLLFSNDRGLRDGDWKAVSFRREAWELYNIAKDRTELKDLAADEPKRLKAMVQMWTDMTKNVLHAPARSSLPTIEAKMPHAHPEWTKFDRSPPTPGLRQGRRGNKGPRNALRARKNTQLEIANGMLQLRFTGEDPGIAMDMRSRKLPTGPYRLKFRLLGGVKGGGEAFYTIDPKVTLPRGKRIEFAIRADGKWQQVEIEIPTSKQIQQLRVDFSPAAGNATVADLKLEDARGVVIARWPQAK
jgi:arylsulfatase